MVRVSVWIQVRAKIGRVGVRFRLGEGVVRVSVWIQVRVRHLSALLPVMLKEEEPDMYPKHCLLGLLGTPGGTSCAPYTARPKEMLYYHSNK